MRGVFRPYPFQWDSAGENSGEESSSLITNENSDACAGPNAPRESSACTHLRPKGDAFWWWAFVTGCVGPIVLGIAFSAVLQLGREKSLQDPSNCPDREFTAAEVLRVGLILFSWVGDLSQNKWAYSAPILAIPIAVILNTIALRLLECHPERMVKLALAAKLAVPLCAMFGMSIAGNTELAWRLLVLVIAIGVLASHWRHRLSLLARLVAIACSIIADNSNLFWLAALKEAAIATSSIVFLLLATTFQQRIGSVVPAPLVLRPGNGTMTCQNIFTDELTPCCMWLPSFWLPVLLAVAYLLHCWIDLVAKEAQTFVVAGTVWQWYFAHAVTAGRDGHGNYVGRSTKRLASSLGTLAVGSLVLYWVRWVRFFTYVNDRRLNENNPISYVCGIFCCCAFGLSCLITPCIEIISKYATHRAAMSGYGFFESNNAMYNTFRHSRLNYVGMGWLPPFVLHFPFNSHIVIALTLYPFFQDASTRTLGLTLTMAAVGALRLTPSLLLAIMDSLYVCFALDLEQQTCTQQAVHDIFAHVPAIGPVWDDDEPDAPQRRAGDAEMQRVPAGPAGPRCAQPPPAQDMSQIGSAAAQGLQMPHPAAPGNSVH